MKQAGQPGDSGYERLLERELSRRQSRETVDPCPQTELLAAWLDRSLPAQEAAAIEKHLASCGRCEAIAAALIRSESEVVYARPRPEPRAWTWHLRWLAPVATAVAVVAVGLAAMLGRPGPAQKAPASPVASAPPLAQAPASPASPVAATLPSAEAPQSPAERAAPQSQTAASARAERQGERVARQAQKAASADLQALAPTAEVAPAAPAAPVPPPAAASPLADSDRRAGAAATPEGDAQQFRMAATKTRLMAGEAKREVPAESFAPGRQVGWRYSRPGVILRTADGGAAWSEQALPSATRISAISAVSPLVCWAAGPGTVLLTVDGAAWRVVSAPPSTSLVSIEARSETAATVRSADGFTYETSDAGASWQRIR